MHIRMHDMLSIKLFWGTALKKKKKRIGKHFSYTSFFPDCLITAILSPQESFAVLVLCFIEENKGFGVT